MNGGATMSLNFDKLTVPLNTDLQGIVRIGGTRITLDTVIGAFHRGSTAEEIVQDYSSLRLDDIYAAITFYLRNRSAVDAYLEEQRHKGDEIQHQIETRSDAAEFRQRWLARRKATA
jgi:uncharacterized protein (DUF433 family)